ncbi:MAG: DUF501 domain-containing protein [Coriobacteriia bacterium]|nr:DUF501 domain-containing protein [Coriobacteriia bacterium]
METRCLWRFPQVLATPPVLDDGTLFPTLYWLSCPWLVEGVSARESDGDVAAWASRLADTPELASRMRTADEHYRDRRANIARGLVDPCGGVGIAGQRDPLATKCLHAHTAAALAGIEDPVGCELLLELGTACSDERCAAFIQAAKEEP